MILRSVDSAAAASASARSSLLARTLGIAAAAFFSLRSVIVRAFSGHLRACTLIVNQKSQVERELHCLPIERGTGAVCARSRREHGIYGASAKSSQEAFELCFFAFQRGKAKHFEKLEFLGGFSKRSRESTLKTLELGQSLVFAPKRG